MSGSLRTGEVAERAGVNIQTLRYYERRGLLAEPARRHSGQREYSEDAVTLVRVIKAAQRLGFTLSEIEELLALPAHRRGTAELRERATAKIRELDRKIEQLMAMRAALSEVVTADCDALTSCSCGEACPLPFVEITLPASLDGE